jgi:hypothetical protein
VPDAVAEADAVSEADADADAVGGGVLDTLGVAAAGGEPLGDAMQ